MPASKVAISQQETEDESQPFRENQTLQQQPSRVVD